MISNFVSLKTAKHINSSKEIRPSPAHGLMSHSRQQTQINNKEQRIKMDISWVSLCREEDRCIITSWRIDLSFLYFSEQKALVTVISFLSFLLFQTLNQSVILSSLTSRQALAVCNFLWEGETSPLSHSTVNWQVHQDNIFVLCAFSHSNITSFWGTLCSWDRNIVIYVVGYMSVANVHK